MIAVYHGGTEIVTHPLVNVGRSDLDFGRGFYVTDLQSQAEGWARKMASLRGSSPIVNKYLLSKTELEAHARYLKFENYDRQWLDFICKCRQEAQLPIPYDVIEGGIADDRVINSVKMYINGYIDAESALNRLRYIKPNNQICIRSQELADRFLKFDSYQILSADE